MSPAVTCRHFFEQASFGIGGLALASLIDEALLAQGSRPPAYKFDYPPKVKRVIYLFMAGAPSQLDLFDPKPALTKHDGQDIPEELIKGERFAFIKGTPKLLASPFQFKRHGQSGAEISELLPNLRSSPTRSRSSARCRRRSSTTRRRSSRTPATR